MEEFPSRAQQEIDAEKTLSRFDNVERTTHTHRERKVVFGRQTNIYFYSKAAFARRSQTATRFPTATTTFTTRNDNRCKNGQQPHNNRGGKAERERDVYNMSSFSFSRGPSQCNTKCRTTQQTLFAEWQRTEIV